jgi:4-amino-4-deoxy-L-arabinose transferase-like glycosyltransferase
MATDHRLSRNGKSGRRDTPVSGSREAFSSASFLIALFLAAFAVRAAAVSGLRHWSDGPARAHGSDAIEFDQLAQNVANLGEYSIVPGQLTAFRAPGFPLSLAALYAALGVSHVVAHLFFCTLGAGTCVLTYVVARHMLKETMARLAGGLCAIYLPHIYFSTLYLSENLFAFLIVLLAWLFIREIDGWSISGMAVTGIVLGYSALTRPYAVLLAPLLGMFMVWRQWSSNYRIRPAALATLIVGFLTVMAPWIMRNQIAFGRIIFGATNGGSTFYGGNNSIVAGEISKLGTWVSTANLPGRDLIDAQPNEVLHDRMEWKLGIEWVTAHLDVMPRLELAKFLRSLLPDTDSPNKRYVVANVLCCTPLLLLSLLGISRTMFVSRYLTPPWATLNLILLGTWLTCLVFWGSPRFRDANAPLLMIFAALEASVLVEKLAARKRHDAVSSPASRLTMKALV